jgi:hypothetical protein
MQSGCMLHRDVKPENVMLSSTPVTDVSHVILGFWALEAHERWPDSDEGRVVDWNSRLLEPRSA